MKTLKSDTGKRLLRLAGRLGAANRILLLTHLNPDGDALGSILALGEGLASLGKKTVMFCQGSSPEVYGFMPRMELLADAPGRPEDYDLVVLLDCHEFSRVGECCLDMGRVPLLAVVDHHQADGAPNDHSVIDTGASSAGELVWRLLMKMKIRLTPSMATNLFVAVSTDTGGFSFDNTSAAALGMAAGLVKKGADPWWVHRHLNLGRPRGRFVLLGRALSKMEFFHGGRVGALTVTGRMMSDTGTSSVDTDGFVDYPRAVNGVELAILFREDGDSWCKVSLRSAGQADAASLAMRFGGGGHYRAAGFTRAGSIEQVKQETIAASENILPRLADGTNP